MASRIVVSTQELKKVDFSAAYDLVAYSEHHSYLQSDKEHYRLLAVLSKALCDAAASSSEKSPCALVDIGSHYCLSAASLWVGANASLGGRGEERQKTSVHTLDRTPYVKLPDAAALAFASSNGIQIMSPDIEPVSFLRKVLGDKDQAVMLVAVDVEPHDGAYERRLVETLMEERFKGILVLDDIRANQNMLDMWNWIPMKKLDVTEIAHWSGTGIVIFAPEILDVVLAD